MPANPGSTPPPRFYTLAEVAQILRVSDKTIRNLVGANKFPKPLRVGTRYRFRTEDVEQWLRDEEAAS